MNDSTPHFFVEQKCSVPASWSPSENLVAADCPKSEHGREPSRFYLLWRCPENSKQADVFLLQPWRQSVIIPPIRSRLAAYCFKLKRVVLACKTGRFAARNRPFRDAICTVLHRVSCRSAPLVVLFVKWRAQPKAQISPTPFAHQPRHDASSALGKQPQRRNRLF